MRIEIKIDQDCAEPKILILTDRMTAEIQELMRKLSDEAPRVLIGFAEDQAEPVHPEELMRVYAAGGKVYASTEKQTYTLRMRLYEAENRLDRKNFVRISQSEIINLKKVKKFDLSFSGTIGVVLKDGTVSYVSRRFVPKIKQLLEM